MSRTLILLACLTATLPATLLPATAFAQERTGTEDKPIIITAQRLSDLKARLKACIAAKCPPNEEIDAALAVAENQFVNGDYRDARETTLATIGRNKRFAKSYPVDVSDLLRANYRIAAHLGDGEAYRIGTFDTLSALKAGLPDDDPRVLGSKIEIGDMYARFARVDEAIQQYAMVERGANKLGLYNLAGRARLRIVAFYAQLAALRPDLYKADARRNANLLIDSDDAHMKPFGEAARVLIARMDAKIGDSTAIDKLIADYRMLNAGTKPILLYAPPIDQDARRAGLPGDSQINRTLARTNYDGEWVDIGFWITPDGKVTDVDVLRGGKGPQTPDWAKPILASIAGRRYAPLAIDASQPGLLRVERFTLVARLADVTGTRLPGREQTAQIETLDLSVDPVPPPPAKN